MRKQLRSAAFTSLSAYYNHRKISPKKWQKNDVPSLLLFSFLFFYSNVWLVSYLMNNETEVKWVEVKRKYYKQLMRQQQCGKQSPSSKQYASREVQHPTSSFRISKSAMLTIKPSFPAMNLLPTWLLLHLHNVILNPHSLDRTNIGGWWLLICGVSWRCGHSGKAKFISLYELILLSWKLKFRLYLSQTFSKPSYCHGMP